MSEGTDFRKVVMYITMTLRLVKPDIEVVHREKTLFAFYMIPFLLLKVAKS